MVIAKPRKKRCDRNHIIYLLTAPSGKSYIGMTVLLNKDRKASLEKRWADHCRIANVYKYDYTLSQCIREEDAGKNFKREIIEVVRGKAEAHRRETQIIYQRKPHLNMVGMGS